MSGTLLSSDLYASYLAIIFLASQHDMDPYKDSSRARNMIPFLESHITLNMALPGTQKYHYSTYFWGPGINSFDCSSCGLFDRLLRGLRSRPWTLVLMVGHPLGITRSPKSPACRLRGKRLYMSRGQTSSYKAL